MIQIKQIRLKNKWTQQYVADQIGITKSAYSNIENQNRSPSLKKSSFTITKIVWSIN